jgi:formaldehyde-activating enzyme involved in methanogenesis
MADNVMLIGESFVGEGADAAHVNPAAADAAKVYANNRAATAAALRAGVAGSPGLAEVLAARDHPVNPFFDPAVAEPAAP